MTCLSQLGAASPAWPWPWLQREPTLHGFWKLLLSEPGLLLQLATAVRLEIQDPRMQGRPKGFTASSFPSEVNSNGTGSCFPPNLWSLSVSKPLSCCGSPGLGADKEVFACSPQPWFVGVLEQMFQRMAVICSLLLQPWGRNCQALVTPNIMLWPHSVTKGQISLCSLAETQLGE